MWLNTSYLCPRFSSIILANWSGLSTLLGIQLAHKYALQAHIFPEQLIFMKLVEEVFTLDENVLCILSCNYHRAWRASNSHHEDCSWSRYATAMGARPQNYRLASVCWESEERELKKQILHYILWGKQVHHRGMPSVYSHFTCNKGIRYLEVWHWQGGFQNSLCFQGWPMCLSFFFFCFPQIW